MLYSKIAEDRQIDGLLLHIIYKDMLKNICKYFYIYTLCA